MTSSTIKITEQWHAPGMADMLRQAGLFDLQSISERDIDWFEPPNERRGGWSGVSRIVLNPDAAEPDQVIGFLKIQQNHFYRSRHTLGRKRMTFAREFTALSALRDSFDFLPEPLYYAEWVEGKERNSVLLIGALDGWISLKAAVSKHRCFKKRQTN